jgi:excinuclease ABC subunit B
MHSDIDTIERIEIIRDLRLGAFDALIGINLLREGLDLPEVSLVAILDADKEGYLRSSTSLIQTMGRAARHLEGRAILYADRMTDSMRQAIGETDRRRAKQEAYNRDNNITPMSIIKSVDMQLVRIIEADYMTVPVEDAALGDIQNEAQLISAIAQMETQMRAAAKNFEFERAATLRDKIRALKQRDLGEIFAPAENPAENPRQGPATLAGASAIDAGDELPSSGRIQTGPKPRGLKAKASKKSV